MFKKLDEMQSRYQILEDRLQNASSPLGQKERVELMKEYSALGKKVEVYRQYQDIKNNIQNYESLLSEENEDKRIN